MFVTIVALALDYSISYVNHFRFKLIIIFDRILPHCSLHIFSGI